jgi:hypothetical protein
MLLGFCLRSGIFFAPNNFWKLNETLDNRHPHSLRRLRGSAAECTATGEGGVDRQATKPMSAIKNENRYQRNLMRLRGFSAGAGARPIDSKHEDDSDYQTGYMDGKRAKRDYSEKSASELGVQIREIVPLKAT